MKTLYIFWAFIFIFCTSAKTEKGSGIDCLEILQIKHEKLLPILDSIIRHEKQCVYYTPKLIFWFHPRKVNDTISIQIGAIGSAVEKSDMYKGCFEFGGHLFLVWDDEYREILRNTNKKRQIYFYTLEKGVIREEDDTHSIWFYHYINNDFIFKEMWENFCKDLNPPFRGIGQ